jgi:hypothetical protein
MYTAMRSILPKRGQDMAVCVHTYIYMYEYM